MKNIVRFLLLALVVSPLLNVASLLVMTGDSATTYMSMYRFIGLGFWVEVCTCSAVAVSWLLPLCRQRYGRWLQHLCTAGYIMGCWVSGDNHHTYVTSPLEPITRRPIHR